MRRCGYPDLEDGISTQTNTESKLDSALNDLQPKSNSALTDPEPKSIEPEDEYSLDEANFKVTKLLEEISINLPTESPKDLIKTRRRRSTVIRTNARVRFNQKLVRWRLLKNSFSRNIPRYIQLSIVRHAFKMWSRVLPLVFIEDNNSHIRFIDIEVGFGKGIKLSKNNCSTGI